MLPRCLQHRAPVRYEILDVKDRKLCPTLAGYKLRPGSDYTLRVETQDGESQGWKLQLTPPPPFMDRPSSDTELGKARGLSIHTRGYLQDNWLQLLKSPAGQLNVKITFEDGRQPYQFEIPVMLARRWLYVPLLIGGSLFGVIPFSWEWKAVTGVAGLMAATGTCFLWDLRRAYRRARALTASLKTTHSAIEKISASL